MHIRKLHLHLPLRLHSASMFSTLVLYMSLSACGRKAEAISQTVNSCPAGYLSVAHDPDYTDQDFCVMKYEAKMQEGYPVSVPAGDPWVNVSLTEAEAACASLGEGFALLSNAQWMTIAARSAQNPGNWTGAITGQGSIYKGHALQPPAVACPADANDQLAFVENDCSAKSQEQISPERQSLRRTLAIESQMIWDLSGNVWEWVRFDRGNQDKPAPYETTWHEYRVLVPTATFPITDFIPNQKAFWDAAWDNSHGIGVYSGGPNGEGGAMIRGGGWYFGQSTGLFSASIKYDRTLKNANLGFRCSYTL